MASPAGALVRGQRTRDFLRPRKGACSPLSLTPRVSIGQTIVEWRQSTCPPAKGRVCYRGVLNFSQMLYLQHDFRASCFLNLSDLHVFGRPSRLSLTATLPAPRRHPPTLAVPPPPPARSDAADHRVPLREAPRCL